MATASELGLIRPAGLDWISGGDDAISKNADVLAALHTAQEIVNAEGRRLVCEPLTLAGPTNTNSATSVGVRIPFRVPAKCGRWRVHIRNYNDRTRTAYSGSLSFTGVTIGHGAVDSLGRPTGQFDGNKFPVSGSFTTQSNGAQWISPWLEYDLVPGQEYVLSYGYTSAAQDNYASVGGGWLTAGGALGVNTDSTGLTSTKNVPLDVWITFDVSADTPQNGYFGDSLTAGVSSDIPVYDSWAKQHAHSQGAFAQIYAYSGTGYVEWDSALRPGLNKYVTFSGISKPDVMYNAMGSNDLAPSDVTQMLTRMNVSLAALRSVVCSDIVHVTVLPRLSGSDVYEEHRKAWNKYLIENVPGNALYTLDAAQALEDATGTLLDNRWRAAPTDIHMNAAGYARYASAVAGNAPDFLRRQYVVSQTAGRTVTVWDYLNNREQMVYGDTGFRDITASVAGVTGGTVRVRRIGNMVYVLINGATRANLSSSPQLALLTSGFRPAYTHVDLGDLHIYTNPNAARLFVQTSGSVDALSASDNVGVYKSLLYPTSDPWPTVLPGTAVGVTP